MNPKHEKFVELANKRVPATVKQIQLIGNLSNRGSYEYTAEEVAKIFKELEIALETAKSRFSANSGAKFHL